MRFNFDDSSYSAFSINAERMPRFIYWRTKGDSAAGRENEIKRMPENESRTGRVIRSLIKLRGGWRWDKQPEHWLGEDAARKGGKQKEMEIPDKERKRSLANVAGCDERPVRRPDVLITALLCSYNRGSDNQLHFEPTTHASGSSCSLLFLLFLLFLFFLLSSSYSRLIPRPPSGSSHLSCRYIE